MAIGDAARWPDWLETLVANGFRVEVLPDAHRAFVRCIEHVIDLVIVSAETAAGDSETLERLRRLSPCTSMLLIGQGCERGASRKASAATTADSVRAISASLGAPAFAREAHVAVQLARVTRERRERLEVLRRLVHRCETDYASTNNLAELIHELPHHGQSAAPVIGLEMLQRSITRELDPLCAARETADFITRCLPDAMVSVWLAGSAHGVGLAACSGHTGHHADALVRLVARVEREHLPGLMTSGSILSIDDASQWGSDDDVFELSGRWAMLAACRSDGNCHAAILLLGAKGARPVPALAALDSVRTILGNHLGLIQRVHLRAMPDWPPSSFDGDPEGEMDDQSDRI